MEPQLSEALNKALAQYPNFAEAYGGHSYGGSLLTIAAAQRRVWGHPVALVRNPPAAFLLLFPSPSCVFTASFFSCSSWRGGDKI